MRLKRSGELVLIAVAACALSACGERRAASPLSPSLLSSPASEDARRAGGTLDPRRVDNDGDGYDDGDPPPDPGPGPTPDPGTGPIPDPGTGPIPDPGTTPDPNQLPPEGLPPVPVQLTISVVGTFGSGAFAPNPLQAAIGNTIVWMNNDLLPHNIVLDDGTPVGNLAPGQSSMPITLVTETAGYRCTLHPSMVGQVVPMPVEPPPTTDPSQGPAPDPNAPPPEAPPPSPPTSDDGGGGGYPDYGDDYYLKARK